jgi:group I intron endonuclease
MGRRRIERLVGIYCIENMINNKKYVGQSDHMYRRFKDHISHLRRNKEPSMVLQNAWNKYGEKSFSFYIIAECKVEELNNLEIFYIKTLESHCSQNGYNISWGGNAPLKGRTLSEETRKKLSIARTGIKFDEDHIKNLSLSHRGIKQQPRSKEHCEKISLAKKGKKQSPEHRAALSNARKGRKITPEVVENMRTAQIGLKRRNATSRYIGVAFDKQGGWWMSGFKDRTKRINIGKYKYELAAAKAYDEYIITNGIDRPINFPDDYKRSLN